MSRKTALTAAEHSAVTTRWNATSKISMNVRTRSTFANSVIVATGQKIVWPPTKAFNTVAPQECWKDFLKHLLSHSQVFQTYKQPQSYSKICRTATSSKKIVEAGENGTLCQFWVAVRLAQISAHRDSNSSDTQKCFFPITLLASCLFIFLSSLVNC